VLVVLVLLRIVFPFALAALSASLGRAAGVEHFTE